RSPAAVLFPQFVPGDCLVLGARPGQGKTRLALELVVEALRNGRRGAFFTLEYTERDIVERFDTLGAQAARFADRFTFDCSDTICADRIVGTLANAPRGTLAVIDYLQLLDQKRSNPALADQVRALRTFGRERGIVFVFVSQIDRTFDLSGKAIPGMDDIRLPNPLDLSLFDKTCFLNDGEVRFEASARTG
ncbi:DNA helicase, partial [uncultured Nitratireductor sp.]|uniref:DNA helicase n=1 Tax=uncultured Nitratireductor sp. TaxID=520953 RepID=UPI0025DE982D